MEGKAFNNALINGIMKRLNYYWEKILYLLKDE